MRLVRSLLFLLFVASAFGQIGNFGDPAWFGVVATPAVSACSSSSTTNAWDEVLEGFQTTSTGYENTWAEGGTATDFDEYADSSALTTYKPTGACDRAFKLTAAARAAYAVWDRGSLLDLDTVAADIYFSLYVQTAPDASGEIFQFLTYGPDAAPNVDHVTGVQIRNSSGNVQLLTYGDGGSDAITILVGQWYVCKLSVGPTVAASTLTVWSNGSQVGSADTFSRNSTYDLRYIHVGAVLGCDGTDNAVLWIDLLAIKSN